MNRCTEEDEIVDDLYCGDKLLSQSEDGQLVGQCNQFIDARLDFPVICQQLF